MILYRSDVCLDWNHWNVKENVPLESSVKYGKASYIFFILYIFHRRWIISNMSGGKEEMKATIYTYIIYIWNGVYSKYMCGYGRQLFLLHLYKLWFDFFLHLKISYLCSCQHLPFSSSLRVYPYTFIQFTWETDKRSSQQEFLLFDQFLLYTKLSDELARILFSFWVVFTWRQNKSTLRPKLTKMMFVMYLFSYYKSSRVSSKLFLSWWI